MMTTTVMTLTGTSTGLSVPHDDIRPTPAGMNMTGMISMRNLPRAVVRKPEILILDDSASALDFATDAALRKAIREKTKGMTVFLVSQRASTIMNSDKIIVMDDGQIAGIGTHRQLLSNCEIYREICQSQLSEEELSHE